VAMTSKNVFLSLSLFFSLFLLLLNTNGTENFQEKSTRYVITTLEGITKQHQVLIVRIKTNRAFKKGLLNLDITVHSFRINTNHFYQCFNIDDLILFN
jgi:hypothetical protein